MQISTFRELCNFIRDLPYRRNSNKDNLATVFSDHCGTCSTKHAVLKQVADENGCGEMELVLGIYKMNAVNTPKSAGVLQKWQIEFIPEAHNYLKFREQIYDFTGQGFDPANYVNDILAEIIISPGQINTFKIAYHRDYLEKWLHANPGVLLSMPELWEAREQCIHALFTQ